MNQLSREAANPEHPYSYFHTGNLETLISKPAREGISIHQAVREFAAKQCVPIGLTSANSWIDPTPRKLWNEVFEFCRD